MSVWTGFVCVGSNCPNKHKHDHFIVKMSFITERKQSSVNMNVASQYTSMLHPMPDDNVNSTANTDDTLVSVSQLVFQGYFNISALYLQCSVSVFVFVNQWNNWKQVQFLIGLIRCCPFLTLCLMFSLVSTPPGGTACTSGQRLAYADTVLLLLYVMIKDGFILFLLPWCYFRLTILLDEGLRKENTQC